MKPAFRRRCIADMYAVNEESALTFVSAVSAMPELDLLRHNMRVN